MMLYDCVDEGVCPFSKGISSKVNVKAQLEFVLAYCEDAV